MANYEKKRIVIAGGNGFPGRILATDLVSRGFEIVSLARKPGRGMPGTTEIGRDGKHLGKWLSAPPWSWAGAVVFSRCCEGSPHLDLVEPWRMGGSLFHGYTRQISANQSPG